VYHTENTLSQPEDSPSETVRQLDSDDAVALTARIRANIERALSLGVIDEASDDLGAAAKDADIVLIAVPVGQIAGVLGRLRGALKDGAVVTDAGSTKREFVTLARAEFGGALGNIVPGHPIAGAERTGVEAATPDLFVGKRVVLTPLPETRAESVECVEAMWRACGAEVIRMSAEHHDSVFSAVSHLPHVLSYALVAMIASRDNAEELFSYAASGFRDFTRIASSDPVMWRDVCIANGDVLVDLIEQYQGELDRVATAIKARDADELLRLFSRAKSQRDLQIGSC